MLTGYFERTDTGATLVPTVFRTTTAWERMRGLLGRPPLAIDEGLLIQPCGSVHTFAMSYPIDLVYLSRSMIVLKIVEALSPWQVSMGFGAAMTLELAAHQAAHFGFEVGLVVEWHPIPLPTAGAI
ncbi:MAG: DUF192 domain-containing protein [Pseudomonadota bacterium]